MTRAELRKIVAAALRPACGYRDFDWEKIADRVIDAIAEAGLHVLGPDGTQISVPPAS